MTAVRKTVTIVAAVDVVVSLSIGAATGALHGAVLVRLVMPTMAPEQVIRLSHWQIRTWTTRVHDYHERLLKEGQEYGKFQ